MKEDSKVKWWYLSLQLDASIEKKRSACPCPPCSRAHVWLSRQANA